MELYKIAGLYQGEDRTSHQSFAAFHVLGRETPMGQDEFTRLVTDLYTTYNYHMERVIDALVDNHGFTKPECKIVNLKLSCISIAEAQEKSGL